MQGGKGSAFIRKKKPLRGGEPLHSSGERKETGEPVSGKGGPALNPGSIKIGNYIGLRKGILREKAGENLKEKVA